jgi:hypothetical protein
VAGWNWQTQLNSGEQYNDDIQPGPPISPILAKAELGDAKWPLIKKGEAGEAPHGWRADAGGPGGVPIAQYVVKPVTTPMAEVPAVGTEGTLWD